MVNRCRGVAALTLALVTGAPAQAQVKLDAQQAAAAFGARERIIDASLSPDGKKVAFVSPGPKQSTIIQILDMTTGTAKPINYANGDPMTLTGCGWVSNQRLVCTLYGVTNRNSGGYLAYSRLIAMDADGNNPIGLAALERQQDYAQQSDGYVVDWRDGTTDSVLLARNYVPAKAQVNSAGSMSRGLGVDLIDTRTGKVQHVESADPLVERFLGDGQGNIRIMATDPSMRFGYDSKGITNFFYRAKDSQEWKPLGTYNSVTEEGIYPIAIDGAANVAYALKKTDGRDALYRIALDGSLRQELAYANPQVDVGGVIRVGRRGRVVAASFSTDTPDAHYFDPEYQKLVTGLAHALPKLPIIRIMDSSADEKIHLIYASSDVDPGRYFLYDSTKKSLNPLGQDRPELAGVPLAEVKPVTYKAADGTLIPAYLTLPPGKEKNLPAIVMPHGGPAARDDWGFDWLAQFFVDRGYAVIQPNYRGSAGFGQQWFQKNGFQSWKSAIGDVDDAGRWLIAEGIADPAKLAIVGWSYGGYAALQSNVVAPDLFKAVVAIAPVTDLGMLRDEKKGFSNMTLARNFIGDGPHLAEGSPARHAALFKAPVLIFHGTKDINVDVAESRMMDKQLRAAGKKSDLTLFPDIDHQLRDSQVRTDMLAKIDAFLATSLR